MEEGKEAISLIPWKVIQIWTNIKHWNSDKKGSWFSYIEVMNGENQLQMNFIIVYKFLHVYLLWTFLFFHYRTISIKIKSKRKLIKNLNFYKFFKKDKMIYWLVIGKYLISFRSLLWLDLQSKQRIINKLRLCKTSLFMI